ncbi:MAG: HD-GYP domain-containing protein [Deltaproteobacteria bacterium]|nr:HD-GYP domain-containing protein [Deltaproteobacteria bacterium]
MIKEISVKSLKPGMYIEDMCTSWVNHPFVTKKKLIKSAAEIELIKKYGIMSVKINVKRGIDVPESIDDLDASKIASGISKSQASTEEKAATAGSPTGEASAKSISLLDAVPVPASDPVPLGREMENVRAVYKDTLKNIRSFIEQTQKQVPLNFEEVSENVDELIKSVYRNRSAATTLIKLKTYDEYTYTHSVNVCVLSLTVGRTLGLSKAALKHLGMGAIFHDLGKVAIPSHILNKPGRLTEEEFEVMKMHPVLTNKLLKDSSDLSSYSLECALSHHEKYGGLGYPQGLKGGQIPLLARIVSLADVYDALTSDRVYREGMSLHAAVKIMYANREDHFDPELLGNFIKCVGVYPIASMVKLNTGEMGLVVDINPDKLLKPQVLILFDSSRKPVSKKEVLNLAKERVVLGGRSRSIVDIDVPEKWGINPAEYL